MTTNLAESINSVLKGVRFLSILGLVKATFYRLNYYWVEHAKTLHAQMVASEVFFKDICKKLAICIHKASSCAVQMFSYCVSAFKVEEPYDPPTYQYKRCYKVNLSDRIYNCGEFQVKKFPCAHAFAAYAEVSLNPCQVVDRIFWLDTIMNIYNNGFHPIGDAVHWPSLLGQRVVLNPSMICASSRPKSTCIRKEMDWGEGREEPLQCGLCRQSGHNRGTCPSHRNN